MLIKFSNFRSVDDLEARAKSPLSHPGGPQLRLRVPILVIDDKEFEPLDVLSGNGFHIKSIKDIANISDVEHYSIILCDLHGVGRKLNPSLEGAHIIKEIKKLYPEKIVIAYTGGASHAIMGPALSAADRYTEKDTSIEEWCDLLDDAIRDVSNPVFTWKRFRIKLLDSGITPIDLAHLEDMYVNSFRNGTNEYQEILDPKNLNLKIPNETKKQILHFIKNAAVKYLGSSND